MKEVEPEDVPRKHKPFVPSQTTLPELTFKALAVGVVMAIILGAANAYLGMKAGLTVAATFPAAVVAMAAMRGLRGSILEENITRTTASVGEALVAGAIFTIPAFVISGVWERLDPLDSTLIMLIGGVLGVLFVIVLRRTMVEQANLPFPESVAAAELVKAGQGSQMGAGYVFSGMGIAGLWEFFKNSNGVRFVADSARAFIPLGTSRIELMGQKTSYVGGLLLESPAASPALLGVGFIVGPSIASVLFCGALVGWLLLVPLSLFLNPGLAAQAGEGGSLVDLTLQVWLKQVRPLAVGTMIVAAFYTLFRLRRSLVEGIGQAARNLQATKTGSQQVDRLEIDLDFKKIGAAIAMMALPVFFLYQHFSGSLSGSILLTVVMITVGFLFTAVAGYLVGMLGSSNNPISGLTLSALVIAGVLMVMIGVTGSAGIMGVLGVAGVVCCAAGIGGDMAWPLVIAGIFFGLALILIKAPSPMLVAVGMYPPFYSTAAIFVGGILRQILESLLARRNAREKATTRAMNCGVLFSSGFIAGEALMAVLLACLVVVSQRFGWGQLLPQISESPWLGLLIFLLVFYLLVKVPLNAAEGTDTQVQDKERQGSL